MRAARRNFSNRGPQAGAYGEEAADERTVGVLYLSEKEGSNWALAAAQIVSLSEPLEHPIDLVERRSEPSDFDTEAVWQFSTHIVRLGDAAVNSIAMIRPWVLTVPLLLVTSLASPSSATTPPSEFAIKEWPTNLRRDLRGTSVKVVLPENALDQPWDDALMAKFRELTGIRVQTVRPGNDTTAVLASYLRAFANGSADADVYAIDIVWPGILSPDLCTDSELIRND